MGKRKVPGRTEGGHKKAAPAESSRKQVGDGRRAHLNSGNFQTNKAAPKRRIVLKIVLLFLLLMTSVIGTAAYSTFLESRRADDLFSRELLRKIEIADSVQNGQIEKLRIISGIVKGEKGVTPIYLPCCMVSNKIGVTPFSPFSLSQI